MQRTVKHFKVWLPSSVLLLPLPSPDWNSKWYFNLYMKKSQCPLWLHLWIITKVASNPPVTKWFPSSEMCMPLMDPERDPSSSLIADPSYTSQYPICSGEDSLLKRIYCIVSSCMILQHTLRYKSTFPLAKKRTRLLHIYPQNERY